MAITEQIGDEDFAIVIVWPCLKGSVLDCLMWTSTWLGEWELGTSVMSLEAAFFTPYQLAFKKVGSKYPVLCACAILSIVPCAWSDMLLMLVAFYCSNSPAKYVKS